MAGADIVAPNATRGCKPLLTDKEDLFEGLLKGRKHILFLLPSWATFADPGGENVPITKEVFPHFNVIPSKDIFLRVHGFK